MTTKDEAKKRIKQLVSEFREMPKYHLDSMNEEMIKILFITPLIKALGWDENDILDDNKILKSKVDYVLRLGKKGVLVIEAKPPKVALTKTEASQALSYANQIDIKYIALTNFKELMFYKARSNIKESNINIKYRLNYKDYIKKFDLLWQLSKQSFVDEKIE